MNIKELLKGNLGNLKKREDEIKRELTKLHNLRDIGQTIEVTKFKELHKELNSLRKKIKELKKLIK